MSPTQLIPAAQYLRMSTDRQEYSIDNQASVIRRYAESNRFAIVRTYEDAGKSGLTIANRDGLKALLTDVLNGTATFKAILVYDVSRFGRFQDCDEAAHYEFLCRSAGIRIHYCAEQFGIDDGMPTRIMKALKRTMAAEFSRELSERVFAGQKRRVEMGYRLGGPAGYGLRRMLVDQDGKVKQELRHGEHKSITTDHVILAPGPCHERKWVKYIYDQFIRGMEITDIAKDLNLRSVPWRDGKPWNRYAVREILRNRKYVGWNVWGKWTQKLHGPYRRTPPDRWVIKEGAFKPVIDQRTFDRAQRVLANKTYNKSNDAVLRDLRRLWKRKGCLSESLLDRTRSVPSCSVLRHRFGSMKKVYELLGFRPALVHSLREEKSRMMLKLRAEAIDELKRVFGSDVRFTRGSTRHRCIAEFPGVDRIGITLCRSYVKPDGLRYWLLYVRSAERTLPALICLMNSTNDGIERFHVMPKIEAITRMTLTPKDPWFRSGIKLESLQEMQSALKEVLTWVPLGSMSRGISNLTMQLMGPARTHIHDDERREAMLTCTLSSTASKPSGQRALMEWDFIRPLILKGEMPNLARIIQRGVYGKLQTLSAPNCPKVYTAIATSTPPEQNGITGFVVGGATANTSMLKEKPLWSILSDSGVSVGLANVPATFPATKVNGYTVTGMLTRGKECEDGLLCAPRLSEVEGGAAVYPPEMTKELETEVGDFWIDCSRMPTAAQLRGKEELVIDTWLQQVDRIRAQQSKLFEYLLTRHQTDFTMLVQSCEDRVGHWLYPIQPHNVGYDPKLHSVRVDAFPNQYRAFDAVLGKMLDHLPSDAYVFVISDHGIKPLREFEAARRSAAHEHGQMTPIIAHHDFEDGDDVPGFFAVMGPNIRHDVRLMGFQVSVFDIAPTVLSLYGLPAPAAMKGRVLSEIFETPSRPGH